MNEFERDRQALRGAARNGAEVELWADGSGTISGPCGWGWVLKHMATGRVKTGCGGAVDGTNNRAELLAVISGLEQLTHPGVKVEIVTDSEYVGKAYPLGWVDSWKRKHWRKVKNPDLWQELDRLVQMHAVSWRWVPGHAGVALNEVCDRAAGECRRALIEAIGEGAPLDGLPFPVRGQLPQGEQIAFGR